MKLRNWKNIFYINLRFSYNKDPHLFQILIEDPPMLTTSCSQLYPVPWHSIEWHNINLLIDWLIDWLIYWSIDWWMDWMIDWLIYWIEFTTYPTSTREKKRVNSVNLQSCISGKGLLRSQRYPSAHTIAIMLKYRIFINLKIGLVLPYRLVLPHRLCISAE